MTFIYSPKPGALTLDEWRTLRPGDRVRVVHVDGQEHTLQVGEEYVVARKTVDAFGKDARVTVEGHLSMDFRAHRFQLATTAPVTTPGSLATDLLEFFP